MSNVEGVVSTFYIRHSMFDIRYSKQQHYQGKSLPLFQLALKAAMRIFELSKMMDNPEVWRKQYLKK